MKTLHFITVSALILLCGNVLAEMSGEVIIVDELNFYEWKQDPVKIVNAKLSGEGILTLKVQYGGGETFHIFKIVATKVMLESSSAQLRLLLSHDNNGDSSKEKIEEYVNFNLQPLFTTCSINGEVLLYIVGQNKLVIEPKESLK